MKRVILVILLLLCGSAQAQSLLDDAALAPIYDFAREYEAEAEIQSLMEGALTADLSSGLSMLSDLKNRLLHPVSQVLKSTGTLLAPVLLLALLRAVLPSGQGASAGAAFLLHISLLLGFAQLAETAIERAAACLASVKSFSDAAAPVLTLLISAMGLEGTASLVSPASALAGAAAQELFMRYGLPLCRIALCTAIAGSLSDQIDLSRFTNLFRKTANWTAGLATTLFTALLSLQGSISSAVDSVAVKTAKFAVDSAAPVIGGGISDAWESYISGVLIAKNAVGVSSIAALLLAGSEPLLICLAAMLLLNLIAALLELFGEKEAARAAVQIAGVCQMALSLSTGALAIGMILLGAAMAVGKNLAA